MAAITRLLREHDGILRASQVRDLGVSRRDLEAAIHGGEVCRPQRGWVALPSTDADLLFAAKHHVVLSCVTQAKRLRLWVRATPKLLHVAVPRNHSKILVKDLVVHWRAPMIPRTPFQLTDSLENVLCHVASCLPHEEALVIWESALNKQLTTHAQLDSLPLSHAARRTLLACTPFSDSGLESLVHSRLRWLPVSIRQQVFVAGHRVDFLIGARLILQIDGAHHTGVQRTNDTLHDAQLLQMNYTVIRVSYAQVIYKWEEVQELVLQAIARGRHLSEAAL